MALGLRACPQPTQPYQRAAARHHQETVEDKSSGDGQPDFRVESHRDSKAELQRDFQRDLQGDFRDDFGGVSRMESEALGLSYSTVTLLARFRG